MGTLLFIILLLYADAMLCMLIVRFLFTFWRAPRLLGQNVNIESISETHIGR